jgi:hypothetical protein
MDTSVIFSRYVLEDKVFSRNKTLENAPNHVNAVAKWIPIIMQPAESRMLPETRSGILQPSLIDWHRVGWLRLPNH